MGISGIGSRNTYIYNTTTGKLSSKDGQQDAFVDYFNGDINGDEDDTLIGFDRSRKADIENLIDTWAQVDRSLFSEPGKEEYEITTGVDKKLWFLFPQQRNGRCVISPLRICRFFILLF